MLCLICPKTWAQGPSGVYDIRLDFSAERSEYPKGTKIYLSKYNWNGEATIDSASIDKKGTARFRGLVHSLDLEKDQIDVFTCGEYSLSIPEKGNLLSFYYSSPSGGNFKEKLYLQSGGKWTRKKPWRDKYGPETEICLILSTSDDAAKQLVPLEARARREAPNSLVAVELSFILKKLSASGEERMADIADERLYYTRLGKSIIGNFLDKFKTSKESIRNMAIDYLMQNRYLTDPKMRAATAMECFRRYSSSIVMGCEGSAVYTAEKYIIGNKDIPEKDRSEASFYTTLNKGTLVGHKAPALSLKDTSGALREVGEMMGAWSVIYFYSDDCMHCKVETPRFVGFLDKYAETGTPINVMTVYTGTDTEIWKQYVKDNFSTLNPFVNWIHAADIERESRFPVDYGVVSTPKMFLLDNDLRIKGRGILTPTLSRMLEDEEKKEEQAYGYLGTIFPVPGNADNGLETETRKTLVDKICQGASSSPESFTRLTRQTFTYLFATGTNYAPNYDAAMYLGQKYILDMPDRWEDTVFVASVRSAVRSESMNRPGSKAENLNLYDIAGLPSELLPSDGKYKVLFFYRSDCGSCEEAVESIRNAYRKYGRQASFTGVYAGSNVSSWRRFVSGHNLEFRQLYDKDGVAGLGTHYYVESVPQILLVAPDGTVKARRINPDQLEKELAAALKSKK